MLVSKNAQICVTTKANAKNIGPVGSPTQNSHVGHVDFMLFVFISFVLVTQREPSLQWNMGFTVNLLIFAVRILAFCISYAKTIIIHRLEFCTRKYTRL